MTSRISNSYADPEFEPASSTASSIAYFNSEEKRPEVMYVSYFYNSKTPSGTWLNTGSGNWFNEHNWLDITNISDLDAWVFIKVYDTNGELLNKDIDHYRDHGIPINIGSHKVYKIMTKDLDDVIDWDGSEPLEGSMEILCPKKLTKKEYGYIVEDNITNGLVAGNTTNLLFFAKNNNQSFSYNQFITTYVATLQIDPSSQLTCWPAFVNAGHDCDSQIDSTSETVNYINLLNTSDNRIVVQLDYYDPTDTGSTPASLGESDHIELPAHGSTSFIPTATGHGMDFVLDKTTQTPFNVTATAYLYNGSEENHKGGPAGNVLIGEMLLLRSQTTTFDSITENMYGYFSY